LSTIDDYVPDAGDVIWTDLDPRTDHEQSGRRPVLVISPAGFYQGAGLVIVCPITSKIRPFNSSVVLPVGFPISGEILTSHVRSLDALARPIRFSGARAPTAILAQVRGKLAILCGISVNDLTPR
jgi:mRNA interferase MazF